MILLNTLWKTKHWYFHWFAYTKCKNYASILSSSSDIYQGYVNISENWKYRNTYHHTVETWLWKCSQCFVKIWTFVATVALIFNNIHQCYIIYCINEIDWLNYSIIMISVKLINKNICKLHMLLLIDFIDIMIIKQFTN